jgi:hypothetical protein
LNEFLKRLIDDFLARAAEPLVADHTLVVDDEQSRRAFEVPIAADSPHAAAVAVSRVSEGTPGELLFVHNRLELVRLVAVGVDAEEDERLVFQVLDERPLVGP